MKLFSRCSRFFHCMVPVNTLSVMHEQRRVQIAEHEFPFYHSTQQFVITLSTPISFFFPCLSVAGLPNCLHRIQLKEKSNGPNKNRHGIGLKTNFFMFVLEIFHIWIEIDFVKLYRFKCYNNNSTTLRKVFVSLIGESDVYKFCSWFSNAA